jgi:hypothetical protein
MEPIPLGWAAEEWESRVSKSGTRWLTRGQSLAKNNEENTRWAGSRGGERNRAQEGSVQDEMGVQVKWPGEEKKKKRKLSIVDFGIELQP